MGLIGFPETSVTSYQYMLRNITEERTSRLHGGGSLKSRDFLQERKFTFDIPNCPLEKSK